MPLGQFTVTIDGAQIGGGEEKSAKLTVTANVGTLNFPDADEFRFPRQKAINISLPYTLTLDTDTTSGDSTNIGYTVLVTTNHGGRVETSFAARQAGSTISLSDVTDVDFVPIPGSTNDALIAAKIGDNTSDTSAALAEALADPAAPAGAYLSATIATLLQRDLDIWDAYDIGASDTYAVFMADIDAALGAGISSGSVVKTDHGASSDATNHIYSYTAGRERAPHLLLIGGSHPNESLSMKAAFRWFEQFATGDSLAMRELRNSLRVTWIPVLVPPGYRSTRFNANSVNINRNYDFYWSYYTPPSANSAKGSAAFSEVEAQVVKGLLDDNKIAAVVDCHTIAATTPDQLAFVAPSPWIAARRDLAWSAASLWAQIYDTEDVGYQHLGSDYRSVPTLVSWAAKYLRLDKNRRNAASVTVEAPESWRGSTMTSITREGMRHYCGFITLWIREWLTSGQTGVEFAPVNWYAYKQYSATTTQNISVTLGGTKIDQNGAWQSIRFDRFDEYTADPSGPRDFIDVMLPYPGSFIVTIDGYVESRGAAGKLLVAGGWDDAAAGTTTPEVTSYTAIEVPATSGDRAPFSLRFRMGYPTVGSIYRVRALINKAGSFTAPELQRVRMQVEFFPGMALGNFDERELPIRRPADSV